MTPVKPGLMGGKSDQRSLNLPPLHKTTGTTVTCKILHCTKPIRFSSE